MRIRVALVGHRASLSDIVLQNNFPYRVILKGTDPETDVLFEKYVEAAKSVLGDNDNEIRNRVFDKDWGWYKGIHKVKPKGCIVPSSTVSRYLVFRDEQSVRNVFISLGIDCEVIRISALRD